MATVTFTALDSLRVGMVDDSAYFRRLLRAMLKGMGVADILEATTIAAGWEIASRQVPDIMLVDWNLGGEDGVRLLDRIRTSTNEAIATQAVVFLSAHTDKRHVLTAARLGANDFIVKPVSPRVLYERMSRLAKSRHLYRRVGDRLIPETGLAIAVQAAPSPLSRKSGRVIAEPAIHLL